MEYDIEEVEVEVGKEEVDDAKEEETGPREDGEARTSAQACTALPNAIPRYTVALAPSPRKSRILSYS